MEMRTIRGFRAYRHPRPNRLRRSRDQAARTQVQELQGLKPDISRSSTARLKSCPDTKQSFCAARKVVP